MRKPTALVTIAVLVAVLMLSTLSGVASAANAPSWTKTYCNANDKLTKAVQSESDNVSAATQDLTTPAAFTALADTLKTAINNVEKSFKNLDKALKKAGAPSGVKDGKKVQKALLAATADALKHLKDAKAHMATFDPATPSTYTEVSGAATDFASALSAWSDANLGALQSSATKDKNFAKLLVKYCTGTTATTTTTSPPTGQSSPTAQGQIAGTWRGTANSDIHPGRKSSFTVVFSQNGATISGSVTFSGGCISRGNVKGTLTGQSIEFGVIENTGIEFTGKFSGNSMSGTYTSNPPCDSDTDTGTWQATR